MIKKWKVVNPVLEIMLFQIKKIDIDKIIQADKKLQNFFVIFL